MRLACAALGIAVIASVSPVSRAADVVDRLERRFAVPARGLRIEATIGTVVITGSARADVAVGVVRRAPTAAELEQMPVQVGADGDEVRVSIVQQRDGRDPRLTSDIDVMVPSFVRAELVRVFEGRVRVSGLSAGCDVDVRRGAIVAADVGGRVRLETGIGGIDVSNAALAAGGMMRLRTFNGDVRLQFARPPENARVLALAFNGTITSDLALTRKDQFGPRFGEATFGSGEPVVSIDVVTGDIAIRVARR